MSRDGRGVDAGVSWAVPAALFRGAFPGGQAGVELDLLGERVPRVAPAEGRGLTWEQLAALAEMR